MEAPTVVKENTKDASSAVLPTEIIPKQPANGEELFLRFVVVVLGMMIGAAAAFIAGLATGWIPFEC